MIYAHIHRDVHVSNLYKEYFIVNIILKMACYILHTIINHIVLGYINIPSWELTYPQGTFEDFPFPKVVYVSFLEGTYTLGGGFNPSRQILVKFDHLPKEG